MKQREQDHGTCVEIWVVKGCQKLLMYPHRECRGEKHGECPGLRMDTKSGMVQVCMCPCHQEK